jgi:hypothetical protein
MRRIDGRGQALVEYVLIAPLLFLIFFAIIQLAYMGLTALAVQRAAMAIAREAAISTDPTAQPLENWRIVTQQYLAFYPLLSLKKTDVLLAIAGTDIQTVVEGRMVKTTVRYPMPIWVPLVGPLFGKTFDLTFSANKYRIVQETRDEYQKIRGFIGILFPDNSSMPEFPDMTWTFAQLPCARMVTSTATVFNENEAVHVH